MGNIIESTTVSKVVDPDEAVPDVATDPSVPSVPSAKCEKVDVQRLSFAELVDRVSSNKDLIDEFGLEFCRLSHQSIKIYGRRCVEGSFLFTHKAKPGCMEIYERDLCFKMLQNFGCFITKIVIDFEGLKSVDKFNQYIQNEVNDFCAKSLIELELHNCRQASFDELTHPFPDVQRVCFKNCHLECTADDLKRLFPVVNRLEVLGCTMAYTGCIEQSFVNLQHLSVQLTKGGLSKETILAALCFNQQLSSLHLVAHVDSTLLHSISQVTPLLQCLHLHILSYNFNDGKQTHFGNVEKLMITLDGGPFINLPIWFDHLTELEVTVNDGLHERFSEFISRNEKLIKLTIVAPSWNQIELYDNGMAILAEKLTYLTDFTLQRCTISLVAAVNFMRKAKMLRDFRFSVTNKLESKQLLLLQIENTWKLTNDKNLYQCERR
ncbi:uncharacterized protein LOC129570583 [Sitodiplosis mosellana]|uniref:uncharacterized protein LOC129570583 n=1 Tax=Sitodiplosis mosellana TaxID=263140 RepID=UPI002443F7ED|nr:uncharacterized protein LOC129570583 [Sitodiplosis mosellana]